MLFACPVRIGVGVLRRANLLVAIFRSCYVHGGFRAGVCGFIGGTMRGGPHTTLAHTGGEPQEFSISTLSAPILSIRTIVTMAFVSFYEIAREYLSVLVGCLSGRTVGSLTFTEGRFIVLT